MNEITKAFLEKTKTSHIKRGDLLQIDFSIYKKNITMPIYERLKEIKDGYPVSQNAKMAAGMQDPLEQMKDLESIVCGDIFMFLEWAHYDKQWAVVGSALGPTEKNNLSLIESAEHVGMKILYKNRMYFFAIQTNLPETPTTPTVEEIISRYIKADIQQNKCKVDVLSSIAGTPIFAYRSLFSAEEMREVDITESILEHLAPPQAPTQTTFSKIKRKIANFFGSKRHE